MTVPTFLASTYRYLATDGVTDVADIITQLRSELVTNGGWSESPANTFKSPVDAVGRFFKVVVSSISATRLQWKVTDQSATTVIDRSFDIDAGGTTIRIFSNPYGVFVEADVSGGSKEFGIAGMLDESPEAQDSHAVYVFGNATRSSAGTDDSNFSTCLKLYMIDNGSAAVEPRIIGSNTPAAALTIPLLSGSGGLLFIPAEVTAKIGGASVRWGGRIYQAYLVDSGVAANNVMTVPIDDVTTGTFRCTNQSSSGGVKLVLRIA